MKYLFVLSLALIVICLAACDRHIESSDPIRSLPADGPIPSNLEVEVNSGSITIRWDISDPSAVDRFRVYSTDSLGNQLALRDSVNAVDSLSNYELFLSSLQVNQKYFFKVAAVSKTGLEWQPSLWVSARMPVLAMIIADDAEYTQSLEVNIQFTATAEASHMIVSEDSTFGDAQWRAFASEITGFSLSAGDAEKTVYGALKFSDGSFSGDLLSDRIILDQTATIGSVMFSPTDSVLGVGDTVTFEVDAGELYGQASVALSDGTIINLRDDGMFGDSSADDSIYSAEWTVPSNYNLPSSPVAGTFTDAAGNVAPTRESVAMLQIVNSPIPVTLSTYPGSSFEVTMNWTRSVSSEFTSYRLYRSASSDVTTSSELLETITNQGTTSFTDGDLDDSTTYFYRVYVLNNFGALSGSNVDSATTLANAPPESSILVGVLQADSLSVSLTWSGSTEDDFEAYQIYADSIAAVAVSDDTRIALISNRGATSFNALMTDSTVYFQLYVVDKHGLSTGSNVVRVDR